MKAPVTKATKICRAAWTLLILAALVLTGASTARAQTYSPHFTLVLIGTPTEVTRDDSFDYGSHPPTNLRTGSPGIDAQLRNGPNPECIFSATSNTGAAQYLHIGASNGYDTSGHYTDPAPMLISLPVPIRWTLRLDCGTAGAITAVVSTEAPPPTPVCPCGTIPGGPLSPSPTPPPPPPAAPPAKPAPPAPAKPAPAKSSQRPAPPAPATPAAAAQTEAARLAAAKPSPDPTPSASPSAHQDPPPAPSATTSGKPTALAFDAAQVPASPRPHRGGHGALPWVVGFGIAAVALVAARYHWGWR